MRLIATIMMDDMVTVNDYGGLARLSKTVDRGYPFFMKAISKQIELFGSQWAEEFSFSIEKVFPSDELLEAAFGGYSRFSLESARLHRDFEMTLRYPEKTFDQAVEEVYCNKEFMENSYLPGLFLSHFLWPHHWRQIKFFEMAFLSEMKVRGATDFLEVGIGTGLYSAMALLQLPRARCIGYDLSEYSLAFAQRLWGAFGVEGRGRLIRQDIRGAPRPEPVEWLIAVEVLEHLEDPLDFLRGLREMLAPGGKAFVTAALNSPNADHLYLYRDPAEVREQVVAAGFSVEQGFCATAYKPGSPKSPVPECAAFIVS